MRWTAPVKRNVWSTMIWRFFRSANSINCSACADVEVNGFSTKTCLPLFSADSANSKWVQTGVTIATASMSGEERTALKSHVNSTFGKSRQARFSDAAFLSQMATTLQPSVVLKFLAIRGPQYP